MSLQDPVPATDRSFLFGDGLFETLLWVKGRYAWPELHLDRLCLGAERLQIPVDRQQLSDALRQTPVTVETAAVRLTLSRGDGPRGYAPGASPSRIRIRVAALERDPFEPSAPARMGVSTIVMGSQPLLAGLKHCNRLEQVLAAQERVDRGIDELVLLNSEGSLQCAVAANVFILHGSTLTTPPCDLAGVAGTRRRLVLEILAEKAGLVAKQAPLSLDQALEADGAILCNALLGIRSVAQLEERSYPPSEAIVALQELYREELRACLGS